ncbi:MAG: hypothetical protein R3351_00465 [Nitrospirales bacterium]|nr:hypothetical protein [Nitrospirales bacterium]
MEGFIGGAIIGITAALLGPALVSGLFKVVIPAGEKIAQGSVVAVSAVSGLVSSLGAGIWGVIESGGESKIPPSSKEGDLIEKIEELGKDIVIDLAEDEAATFIKMVLLAAL